MIENPQKMANMMHSVSCCCTQIMQQVVDWKDILEGLGATISVVWGKCDC